MLRYLATGPRVPETDRIFLTTIAPVSALRSSDAVSSVVTRAFQRAGIHIARPGAHVLRHTAATEMLRHGVSLDYIGLVLRYRSLDMSATTRKSTSPSSANRAAVAGEAVMKAAVTPTWRCGASPASRSAIPRTWSQSFARFAHDRHEAHPHSKRDCLGQSGALARAASPAIRDRAVVCGVRPARRSPT